MRDVRLVATREIRTQLGSRLFVGVNLLLAVVILGGSLLPGLLGDGGPTVLGVVGEPAAAVAEAARGRPAVGTGPGDGALRITELADDDAARAAIEAGEIDAALIGPSEVVVDTRLPSGVRARLRAAGRAVRLGRALSEAGVPPAEQRELLSPAPLQVTTLSDESGVDFGPQAVVGLAATALLYGLLIWHGQTVGQGIVREKESRIIEVLLATVTPTRLLAGKVLGLGLLGLGQVLLLAAIAGLGLQLGGQVTVTGDIAATLLVIIAWYVLGFALYAALFALVGAVVSRVEDLQSASMPVVGALVGALVLAQFTLETPDSTAGIVAGLLPFSAPLVQPLRVATNAAHAWQAVLAVVLTVATIAAVVPLAARVYTGAALVTERRIGLGDALRRTQQ